MRCVYGRTPTSSACTTTSNRVSPTAYVTRQQTSAGPTPKVDPAFLIRHLRLGRDARFPGHSVPDPTNRRDSGLYCQPEKPCPA